MNMVTHEKEESKHKAKRVSFGLGNLLLVIAIIAISLGWWVDRNRAHSDQYDVQGGIRVSYTIRKSSNSTAGGVIEGVEGIDFRGSSIVVYRNDRGVVLPANNLIDFNWVKE